MAEGAAVAVLDKDLADLAGRLPAVRSCAADVTDPTSVADTLLQLEAGGFFPDVLVNNAGVLHSAPLINMLNKEDRVHSAAEWRRVLTTNLSSVFYVTGRVVDQMLKRRTKGIVISLSSIAAKGNAGQSAYSAAKAGVNALTRTWAKELGSFGIRFVAIAPGYLDTESTRAVMSEANFSKIEKQVPLHRLGKPEHVYQAIRFIVENDYINGTVLEVDGGLTV